MLNNCKSTLNQSTEVLSDFLIFIICVQSCICSLPLTLLLRSVDLLKPCSFVNVKTSRCRDMGKLSSVFEVPELRIKQNQTCNNNCVLHSRLMVIMVLLEWVEDLHYYWIFRFMLGLLG